MRTVSASLSTIFASALLLAASASAQINGQIASVDSASSYCFFLPPVLGGDIAANEDRAIAFCNAPNAKAPGAKIFPEGFVTSVHFATGPEWIQVSGQIDPTKYQLNPCDAGGQYDIKAPVGATCAGYAFFVNVIEPMDGIYGMRCCKNKPDCDVTHSTYGARRIFGATTDFSGPAPDGNLPAAANCVNGTLPSGSPSAPTQSVPTTKAPSGNPMAPTPSTPAPKSSASQHSAAAASSTAIPYSSASSSQIMMFATTVVVSVAGLVLA
ncbi:hypothetical protein DFQ27_005956 [Actinomortierella ambigua]|uniref:Uncharacterized protein n=1 Tax=Actinomortierella ambigua TaxID=1343610 RepID=A0A9P6UC02_9FUNG|nr:hypothetical protein DFQ27_005956 [Actinomortierella ambigua]